MRRKNQLFSSEILFPSKNKLIQSGSGISADAFRYHSLSSWKRTHGFIIYLSTLPHILSVRIAHLENTERNGNLAHTLLTVTRAEAPIHHSGTLNLISNCVFAGINRHFYLGNKSFILHSFTLLSDVVYLMTFTREAEKMCENTIQAKNYSSSDGLIYGFVLTTECVFSKYYLHFQWIPGPNRIM